MAEHGNYGLRKAGTLSDTEILYFEGRNTAKFQFYAADSTDTDIA